MNSTLQNHWWWRPGVRQGRHWYTWHTIFHSSEQLRAHVAAYQEALQDFGFLDPVPLEWLHLTMQDIGFTDEVTRTELDKVLTSARGRLAGLGSFEIEFGAPSVWGEGVVICPTPTSVFGDIHHELREAISSALGSSRLTGSASFTPHVSLGYANDSGPTKPIASALAAVSPTPVKVEVSEISLLSLDRDTRVYKWDLVGTAPL